VSVTPRKDVDGSTSKYQRPGSGVLISMRSRVPGCSLRASWFHASDASRFGRTGRNRPRPREL
jgi:hypothetical protein